MKKELSAREYVVKARMLLDSTSVVAANLAFHAAGLAAGKEEAHRKKLLESIVNLRMIVEGLLNELADEDEVAAAEDELMKKVVEMFLKRFEKEAGE